MKRVLPILQGLASLAYVAAFLSGSSGQPGGSAGVSQSSRNIDLFVAMLLVNLLAIGSIWLLPQLVNRWRKGGAGIGAPPARNVVAGAALLSAAGVALGFAQSSPLAPTAIRQVQRPAAPAHPITPAAPVRRTTSAAVPVISAFYLSDLQGCSALPGRSRPPQVLDFADSARLATLYIDYAGATPGVTRFDIQWYRDGRPYGMDSWHPGAAGSILAYCKEYAPIGAGDYRLDLRVDGSLVRSTTMHVRAPVEMDDPAGIGSMALLGTIYRRIPVGRQGALEVPVLYASDPPSPASREGGSLPPPARSVAPHPVRIAIFYEYTNADPGVTAVRLVLHIPSGRTRTFGPRLLPVISGLQREQIGSDVGFPSGRYRIELQADGRTRAEATFTART